MEIMMAHIIHLIVTTSILVSFGLFVDKPDTRGPAFMIQLNGFIDLSITYE